MTKTRQIDDRDVDRLLSALSDIQIASVFAMPLDEVLALRQSRRSRRRSRSRFTSEYDMTAIVSYS